MHLVWSSYCVLWVVLEVHSLTRFVVVYIIFYCNCFSSFSLIFFLTSYLDHWMMSFVQSLLQGIWLCLSSFGSLYYFIWFALIDSYSFIQIFFYPCPILVFVEEISLLTYFFQNSYFDSFIIFWNFVFSDSKVIRLAVKSCFFKTYEKQVFWSK